MLRIALFLTLIFSPVLFAKLVVVVAKDSAITELDENTVQNIFLSRTNRYPDGNKAKPIELHNNEHRKEFYTLLTGKSPKQLSAYWTTLIFSGKGTPPKKYNELDKLLETINTEVGMITYLDSSSITDDMKVVYTFN